MYKALFIVFEGIDGSGTTTQCKLLAQYLEAQGYEIVQTREPGGTSLAEKLRSLLLDPLERIHPVTEMLLYAASRAQHVHERIIPALQMGKPVICDRFIASSLAYQGYGRGLGNDVVLQVNSYAVNGCWPDLTIYLDLPVEVARSRLYKRRNRPDRLEQAGASLQEKVRQAYRSLASKQPECSLIIDATKKSKEELAVEIRSELESRWPLFPFRS